MLPIGQTDAVFFDFDGVIVDTEPLHFRAFQKLLIPLGLGYTWQEYVKTYMGFDDRDAFIEVFNSHGKQLSLSELKYLIDTKADIFQDIIKSGVEPYPGVIDLIKHIHSKQIPLAICSGALRSDILPILSMLGIDTYFNFIVSAEDVPKSKPDPASYMLTFERCKTLFPGCVTPARSLAIEDTPAGVQSAKGAGLTVVAVTNSYSNDDLASADLIVPSLISLLEAF